MMSILNEEDVKTLYDIDDNIRKLGTCVSCYDDLQHDVAVHSPKLPYSQKNNLLKNPRCIVVVGESNAGKTTFINTLLEKPGFFKTGCFATTKTFTRIHYSKEYSLKTYTKEQTVETEEEFEDQDTLRVAIEKLTTNLENRSDESQNDIHFIDIFLPDPFLKGNVVIVDTPDFGENEKIDEMTFKMLLTSKAFVFICNPQNIGGVMKTKMNTVLENISNRCHKMPSIDIKNVFFLTNQWDNVENSIFCPTVNVDEELEKIWQRAKHSITDIWKELPVANIFQISLKQVQLQTESKYRDEYNKFQNRFSDTITDGMNKLVTFDFKFIQRFYVRTKMEVLATLKIQNKSEKEILDITDKIEQQLYNFERDKIKEQVNTTPTEKSQSTMPKTSVEPEDDVKRLNDMFDRVQEMVTCDDFDHILRNELSEEIPNYMKVLDAAKRDLLQNDCGIVVTGETSAGKTTLINTLVGVPGLFKPSIHPSTAAITRIRKSDDIRLTVHSKEKKLLAEGPFADNSDLKRAIMELSNYTNKEDIYYTDVHLPIQILKGNVIIVDTPGIGDNEKFDDMLLDFLPNAVAFVFVINPRNAGGFQKDRIGKILKTVTDNQQNMPCFDIKDDALFLTNQWDSVEDAIFDKDDIEIEVKKTYERTKSDITNHWEGLPLENIFQISLKQQHEEKTTKYTAEYERFSSKLTETIDRNQNKRVQVYFEFIQNVLGIAKIGALARLEFMNLDKIWEEEHDQMMMELTQQMAQWQKDNIERKQTLEKLKKESVDTLSQKLEEYLRSPVGKAEILNTPGRKKITEISYWNISTEVGQRIQEGIIKWSEKPEAQEILEKAENEIQHVTHAIDSQLNIIASGLVGIGTAGFFVTMTAGVGVSVSVVGVLAFQLSFALSVAIGAFIGPIFAIFGTLCFVLLNNGLDVETMIRTKYDQAIAKLSSREIIEASIGKKFEDIINTIFNKSVPQQIEKVTAVCDELRGQYEEMKEKRKSTMRLKDRIDNIEEEIHKFRT